MKVSENENEPFFARCSDSQFWGNKERVKPRSRRICGVDATTFGHYMHIT